MVSQLFVELQYEVQSQVEETNNKVIQTRIDAWARLLRFSLPWELWRVTSLGRASNLDQISRNQMLQILISFSCLPLVAVSSWLNYSFSKFAIGTYELIQCKYHWLKTLSHLVGYMLLISDGGSHGEFGDQTRDSDYCLHCSVGCWSVYRICNRQWPICFRFIRHICV